MTIRKYEFDSIAEFIALANVLLTEDVDFSSYPTHSPFQGIDCTIVKLVVYTTEPEYDEQGELITPGVLSPKFHVDICYHHEALAELEPYEVWPAPVGQHIFAGWTEWYEQEYQKRQEKNNSSPQE